MQAIETDATTKNPGNLCGRCDRLQGDNVNFIGKLVMESHVTCLEARRFAGQTLEYKGRTPKPIGRCKHDCTNPTVTCIGIFAIDTRVAFVLLNPDS